MSIVTPLRASWHRANRQGDLSAAALALAPAVLLFAGPWMMRTMTGFARQLFAMLPALVK